MAMSVDAYSRKRGLDKKTVVSALQHLGRKNVEGHTLIRRSDVTALDKTLNVPVVTSDADSGANAQVAPQLQLGEVAIGDDPPAATAAPRAAGGLPVFLHDDVVSATEPNGHDAHLRSRVHQRLQQLMAHGRTPTVKGVKGANSGWRRAPLGGNGGMQWYLWWAPASATPLRDAGLPQGALAVRAVRHHDDTDQRLDGGAASDYLRISPADLQSTSEDQLLPAVWTAQQLEIVASPDGIKVVQGYPGAGKTSTLWQTVCQRGDERVLYLTWSDRLSQAASEYFGAFAAESTEVQVHPWRWLLAELLPDHVTQGQSLSSAAERERFIAAFERLPDSVRNGWRDYPNELYGELRAYLVGRVEAWTEVGAHHAAQARLSDDAYLALRAPHLGEHAARQALKIADKLADRGDLSPFFPAPSLAIQATQRLLDLDQPLPESLLGLDRLVVDELQDLTIAGVGLLGVLAARVAHERADSRAPFVVVAGDEGQTVRPTGFQWGPAKTALRSCLGVDPWALTLEANVRCPKHIAGIVNDLGDHYRQIDKQARPKHMRQVDVRDASSGRVIVSDVAQNDEATVAALRALANDADVALVVPSTVEAAWVVEACGSALLTPDDVKGLDFASVVVLDAGRTLHNVRSRAGDAKRDDNRVDGLWCRTTLDRLRVALSRATESLSFLELSGVGVGELERLTGPHTPIRVAAAELADQLIGDLEPGERARQAAQRALDFLETSPRIAWRRANEALRTLGEDPSLPGAVADLATRQEVTETFVQVALTLACRGPVESLDARELLQSGRACLPGAPELRGLAALFTALVERPKAGVKPAATWYVRAMAATAKVSGARTWLTQLVEELRATWEREFEALLDPKAKGLVSAARQVPALYRAAQPEGAAERAERRLAELAEALLATPGQRKRARAVVDLLASPPALLSGRAWEAADEPDKAIEVYREAALWAELLDCGRRNGKEAAAVEAAAKIPDAVEAKAARWAFDLKRQLRRAPEVPLTEAEREAVRRALPTWAREGRAA